MKRITVILALTTLAAWVALPLMAGGVPGTINLQGRLTDGAGNNVADGVYSVVFRIYDDPIAGATLWSETLPVQVTGGLFTVLVGSSSAIPADLFSSGSNRYLGVTVGLDPEMPRIPLNSVAYAYQAQDADVATLAQDLTCVGCVSASEVDPAQVQLRVTGTAPVGEYITGINQNGTVTTAPDANNAYTAGTGLVLNGTQFAIPPDGVTSTEIAADAVGASEIATGAVVGGIGGDILDGAISTDDIQDNTISAVDIAADAVGEDEIAAGAVTSTEILDATVRFSDLGQNGALGNQVIKWDGAAWVAGNDDVGAGGGGGDITGVSPGTGMTGGGLSGDVTLGIALGGVTRDEILDGTIASLDLGPGSVGADEIDAGAVVGGVAGDIADGTLTVDDLGTNSVGADEIAAGAVAGGLGGDLADGTLTADDLGTNSVGSDEIATGAVGSAEIAANAVGASQIALGAVGSSEVADNSLLGTDIADGTIFAADIGVDAVASSEIVTDAVGSDEIAIGAVGTGEIAVNAVNSAHIALSAVGTSEVADGSLLAADIATDAVGAAEIATDAVGAAEIAADAVGASEIAAGAVGTSEVADNSLTAVDIADEPGVASHTGVVVITLDGTVQTLLSRNIIAPAPGYVLVIATAQVSMFHTNGFPSQGFFGVSLTAGVFPSNQEVAVDVPVDAPTGWFRHAVTVHGLFSTLGGEGTFYFLGEESFGELVVSNRQLTLIYFPTAHGFVVPTSAPSGGETISDQSAQSGSVLPETGGEPVQAPAANPTGFQQELAQVKADMEARIQKLEEHLRQIQPGAEEKR